MKRSTKRFTSLIIVLCLLFTLVVPVSAIGNDISKHWASGVMQKWVAEGLLKGYADGSYKPNNSVTRAEFLSIISRVFNYVDKSDKLAKDVPANAWSADCISKALAMGLVSEDANGNVKPSETISRQEAAIIISKAFNLKVQNIDSIKKFTDFEKFSAEGKEAIAAMAEKGYIKGNLDKSFGYSKLVTRAEAFSMINNAMGTLKKAPGTYTGAVTGNLVVNTKDVVLKDMTISGDLYLAQGIGNGNATLENVKVAGKTYVFGGGSNSVMVKDSILSGTLVLLKKDGNIRVVALGSTEIPETLLNSGAKLEEDKVTGKGFGNVKIQQVISNAHKFIFAGDFSDVVLEVMGASIQVLSGTINNFIVEKSASDAKIVIEKNATISTLTANAALSVTGQGIITNAIINAAGVVIAQKPVNIKIAAGLSANIGGVVVYGTPAPTVPSTGNNTDDPTPPIPTPIPATTISGKVSFDVAPVMVTSTSIQLKKDGADVGNAVNPNADGTYVISGVNAGTYTMVVSLADYQTVITPAFAVSGIPVIKDVTLLKQSIIGKITVNAGYPDLTATTLQLVQCTTVTGSAVTGSAITGSAITGSAINADAEGNYCFTGIAKGQYDIHVSLPGYTPTTISAITVTDTVAYAGTTSMSAILANVTGKVSFTVATVNVTAAGIQLKHGETSVGSEVHPGTDGSYTITGIAPGNYTINASLDGYITSTVPSFNIAGTNVDGKDITLTKKTAAGSLYFGPSTAVPGDIHTLRVIYFLDERLDKGTVVFTLPDGFAAAPGDMINIGSSSSIEATLTSEQISNNGKTVTLANITSKVGELAERITLILKDKLMPAIGKYIFSAVADADGSGTLKCANDIASDDFEAKNGPVDDFESIPTNEGVRLKFSPSPDAASVVLEQSSDDGKTFTTVSGISGSSGGAVINGLTNGDAYLFRLVVKGGKHDGTDETILTSPTKVDAEKSTTTIDKPLRVSSDGTYSSTITANLLDSLGKPITNANESLYIRIIDFKNNISKELYINGNGNIGDSGTGDFDYLITQIQTGADGKCSIKVILKAPVNSDIDAYMTICDSCNNIIGFFPVYIK